MSNLIEKLNKLSAGQSSNWKEKAKFDTENRDWLMKSAMIALRVISAMRAQQLTQKALAERLGVSPQQVHKITQGSENLTLETITKLEKALGIVIIDIVSKGKSVKPVMTVVRK